MIAFVLTMPNRGSWNGRWSGENDLYAFVKTERAVPKEIVGKSFYYTSDYLLGIRYWGLKEKENEVAE